MRHDRYAAKKIDVSMLLDILRFLKAYPNAHTTDVAKALGIARSTFHRILAGAERDLGVVVSTSPDGSIIKEWGVLNSAALTPYKGAK